MKNPNASNTNENLREICIVPHTHWDREWYLPFQKFRFKLVKLIDTCLELDKPDYFFMLDGQTVVIEDYLEIKPEKRSALMLAIRERHLGVGPWYLLPDEWLVGQESLIRNLERAHDIALSNDIPLMPVGYLPDCFGHTRAIPQIFADLASCQAAVVWRGAPPSLKTVPFTWKSHESSTASILGIYLPQGYGNAAHFAETWETFLERICDLIMELEPFSPVPVYLLMNGADHLFPQPFVLDFIKKSTDPSLSFTLGSIEKFVAMLQQTMQSRNYIPPVHAGEMRSFARAPLLHDTLSMRMWIKQENQQTEDLLVCQAEPLCTYAWYAFQIAYPSGFFAEAWRWHLQNQPHDSICGCSVDQTHEDMKTRFFWAKSIAESMRSDAIIAIKDRKNACAVSCTAILNATNCTAAPVYTEIEVPEGVELTGVQTPDGKKWAVQRLRSASATVFEGNAGPMMVKLAMKMANRKIADWYINSAKYFEGPHPGTLEVRVTVDKVATGELDVAKWKKEAEQLLASKKYKKFHVIAAQPANSIYGAVLPLKPWAFSKVDFVTGPCDSTDKAPLTATKDSIDNKFYSVDFQKDGTFSLTDKRTGTTFGRLHSFEDWGDRGDEYTFGRLGPEKAKPKHILRRLTASGPVSAEITQTMTLALFREVDASRRQRTGEAAIAVTTTFRFYARLPQIDIETKLANTARDHRLRICFELPFRTDHSLTSTHFGTVKRQGEPEKLEQPAEKPTGIQPQKRYIRINAPNGKLAVTLANMGLPEVELVAGNCLALTLLRCVGWLSRDDFPERPVHAGPHEATPEAQEPGKPYVFSYSLLVHAASDPLYVSDDFAEAFAIRPQAILYALSEPDARLLEPALEIRDPWIRISSLRIRDGKVLVTAFNLADQPTNTTVRLGHGLATLTAVRIDGTTKETIQTQNQEADIHFEPHEIKMLRLS